jgi:hypothetical protein
MFQRSPLARLMLMVLLLFMLVPLTTGDCSEALLPCCVPYLQLHPFVVQEDLLDLEVNPVDM